MILKTTMAAAVVFLLSCAAQSEMKTGAKVHPIYYEDLVVTGTSDSKTMTSKDFEIIITYMGTERQSFNFRVSCVNSSARDIILSCERSLVFTETCRDTLRLPGASLAEADVKTNGSAIVPLRFDAQKASAFACLMNEERVELSGLAVIINGERRDIFSVSFPPSSRH